MSLLFNMLSKFIIIFLPRSKHLLISWLQSASAVILEPKTIKSLTVSIVSPSICPEVMGLDAMEFAMVLFRSVQFSSVAQSCPTLCHLMNRSTPGHAVHHQLHAIHDGHLSTRHLVKTTLVQGEKLWAHPRTLES